MTKRSWGLFLLSLLTITLLCFAFLRPDWLARLVAVAAFWLIGDIALLIYGFHPKSEFLYARSKIARVGSERAKRNARRVLRILTVVFGFFILVLVVVPVMADCIGVARSGPAYLLQLRGQVTDNNILLGTYFLNQDVLIIKQGDHSGESHLAMFFPRVAQHGTTYWFMIAPTSKLVLDWQPTNDYPGRLIWK
jgi:hypothetical protein